MTNVQGYDQPYHVQRSAVRETGVQADAWASPVTNTVAADSLVVMQGSPRRVAKRGRSWLQKRASVVGAGFHPPTPSARLATRSPNLVAWVPPGGFLSCGLTGSNLSRHPTPAWRRSAGPEGLAAVRDMAAANRSPVVLNEGN